MNTHQIITLTLRSSIWSSSGRLNFCCTHAKTFSRYEVLKISKLWWSTLSLWVDFVCSLSISRCLSVDLLSTSTSRCLKDFAFHNSPDSKIHPNPASEIDSRSLIPNSLAPPQVLSLVFFPASTSSTWFLDFSLD